MTTVTYGPTYPHGRPTILVLDDAGNPALLLDIEAAARLVDDLAGLVAAAVRRPGSAVLEECIDLGIPAARSENGAGQEQRP